MTVNPNVAANGGCNVVDMLSRLPVDNPESANSDKIEPVSMLTVNKLLVTAQQIAEYTLKDTTLTKIYDYTLHGSPKTYARFDEVYPFFVRKEELSLEERCIGCFMSYTPCTRECEDAGRCPKLRVVAGYRQ